MEQSDGTGFVDFANQMIHIGHIIPQMTQEEVLFSCCPECFVSLLFVEKFLDNEAMIIRGVQRVCTYTGYFRTFQVSGLYPRTRIHDIVVIDACYYGQFLKHMLIRDLNKAWLGFARCNGKISTGHWGCGAFGGDKILKFLQQMCAATLCPGASLDYSTYQDTAMETKFKELLKALEERHITIRTVFAWFSEYGEKRPSQKPIEWIQTKLVANSE